MKTTTPTEQATPSSPTTAAIPKPPATRTVDVVDVVHATRIPDPYRWLEDGESQEVRDWTAAENAYTRALLDARPGREAMRARMATLLAIGTVAAPVSRGGFYFHLRRDGAGQNQPILYVRQGVGGADRPLVDPNPLSADGTATIDWWYPSHDGRLLAYGVSTAGDEKSVLHVREIATGKDLPDTIPQTRYCALGWKPDGSGFYYTRYPAPGSVPAGQENYNRHVFYHALGSDPAADPYVYGKERRPDEIIEIDLSDDGRWLTATVFDGWAKTDVLVRDLSKEGSTFVPVATGLDAIFTGGVVEGVLYLRTNFEAPRYRLLAVDPLDPDRTRWKTLIPEGEAVLDDAQVIGGRIVTRLLRDASSRLAVHDRSGKRLAEIALPGIGTVSSVTGEHDGVEAFFDFASYTAPPAIRRYDLKTGKVTVWDAIRTDVDLTGFEVQQRFFPSKDGTRIPMFVVMKKGRPLDGNAPTILYGYGGFNVSQTPDFSRSLVWWLERGGVYAEAQLRGGGEYGEAWHRAGMLDKKQNVFDDFLAAARYLVAAKYTKPERLAVYGGSNGGLLVGAAITQGPDLFHAAVCAVPLLDMVRYHQFQIARLWVPEYGSSESAAQFRTLYAYSPYHHVTKGTAYPAVLLTAAESDSRVDPMHARKMAARLQASTSSTAPILLRIESRAGHGVGKPISKQIDESTDVYGFFAWQLGLEGR
ncbi:MAG TPA: prolyl oligopeptidase family serine peptidase [Candidatus Polarisedimenticolia bacterium]|nr:prolyl oligopeptidase family serine peptidase [Candidatus Polarisedimenticolia bacterium]